MSLPTLPGLLEALRDPKEHVRARAAWALGEIGDARAMHGLLEVLSGPKLDVRYNAAVALGKIGEPAVPKLRDALRDPEGHVRGRAAVALTVIASKHREIPVDLTVALEEYWNRNWWKFWKYGWIRIRRFVRSLKRVDTTS